MTHRIREWTRAGRSTLGALVLLGAVAERAPAQDGAPQPPRSAQCRYSPEGKLVFSPRGVTCPAFAVPPAAIALDSELVPRPLPPAPAPAAAAAAAAPASGAAQPVKSTAQPAVAVISRLEVSTLLAERERLDAELGRIREAVAYEDREAARRVVDEALARIARHLEHEARLLQPLAAAAGR